ncbi:MAG TPA: hypothetical protein VE398_12440 [Acidobacteriota bacterium]|nr:hypothetical protein [Acidobacteriota bacterium]
MTKKWIAVNLALLTIACLLGWQLKVSVDRFNVGNDLAKLQPVKDVKQKLTPEGGLPALKPPVQYSAAEFAVIPEKTIFSPTRAREEKEVVAAVPETPPLQQKPILVGVAISGDRRLASIVDPAVPAGPKRKTQTKQVGDVYQGYTITDITEDQMILESGTRREVIPLHDGAKRSGQQGKTAILATRIVNFGGGGAGGGTSAMTVATARPAGQQGAVASSIGSGQRPGAPAQQAATRPGSAPAAVQQAPAQPAGIVNPSEIIDAQGRRVIRTPFGDIPRDK